MVKQKIIIVEDNSDFATNYYNWLGNHYDLDSAENAEIAIDKLSTNYYALVILDLSLAGENREEDRSSELIQIFLKNNLSPYTRYIIVSGLANKEDIRKAFRNYNVEDVFWKSELVENIQPFLQAVNNAINDNTKDVATLIQSAINNILYNVSEHEYFGLEDAYVKTLKLKNSNPDWYNFKRNFFTQIAPIYTHKTQAKTRIQNNCVLALCWSRKLGAPISICIADKDISTDGCLSALNSWLGWGHDAKTPDLIEGNIQGYYFLEHLNIDDFNISY